MNSSRNLKITLSLLAILIFSVIAILYYIIDFNGIAKYIKKTDDTSISNIEESKIFKIISSSENEEFENYLKQFAFEKNIQLEIDYAGTLEIMELLNQGKQYDAIWCSNSIWLYMLNSDIKVTNSVSTSINPVIFGVTKSKAEELNFIGKDLYTQDIISAINSGNLKFSMANPTRTNTGATAYLGLLATLAGRPEVLREEHLDNTNLKTDLVSLFSGLERSSGEEDFLEEMFLQGGYEAVITYESSIIDINKKLEEEGKEILYALYPRDGVSISDSPFAYIDNGNEAKKTFFIELQDYILSDLGRARLQDFGRRTWYGGITDDVDKNVFNPEWGIDTTKYISTVKYPNANVIKKALNLYQSELRKATHVVFCLDYSGSMQGEGYEQLVDAMEYILNEKQAGKDLLQFSEKDKISIIPFSSDVIDIWQSEDGSNTSELLKNIRNLSPTGSTAIYPTAQKALEILADENANQYNLSIILMTDGEGNHGTYSELENVYQEQKQRIPIYSIMFGEANEKDLREIADLSNAKVFDGRVNLLEAFKEVRGYN
ncbi:MAG: VWA domain-containing protein [Clostridia bacterium]|nr:VWA domain-containing protein [Clostridia bacterium]